MVIMAGLGPPLLRVKMTTLAYRVHYRQFHVIVECRCRKIYGLAAQKANRYPVLIQLIALSETPKCWEAVVDMEEKVNHCGMEF